MTVIYDTNASTPLQYMLAVTIAPDSAWIFCLESDSAEETAEMVEMASMVLSSVYLAIFVLSIFSCRKMLGVELMLIVQLSFYSLIPINI